MSQRYEQICVADRNFIHRHLILGRSLNWIAGQLGRAVSTISREVLRNRGPCGSYDASCAGGLSRERRRRGPVKLREGSPLRAHVFRQIRKGWSPQQISGSLSLMSKENPPGEGPPDPIGRVSHETIYQAIYILPRGEIRKEIIGFLRQGRKLRRPRSAGKDRRGSLTGMVSIHERPQAVLTRELFGNWEGDLIKGAGNASAIGTLVERKSRFTLLAKMKNCSADAALAGFDRSLNRVPAFMRQTLTYDQGKEMAHHQKLANQLKIKVYFCDPHSPWQRPSNENMNGLVRQYLPKGIDLTIYSQSDLDKIAHSLNTRPRACLGFKTPEQVFYAEIQKPRVALQI